MQTITFDENIWFAITEPSRRRLIDILLISGEITASKLANELTISRQAISKHMAVLKKAGLIKQKKSGREVRYSIEPMGMNTATQELAAAASQWDSRLLKIKQIAESIQMHDD